RSRLFLYGTAELSLGVGRGSSPTAATRFVLLCIPLLERRSRLFLYGTAELSLGVGRWFESNRRHQNFLVQRSLTALGISPTGFRYAPACKTAQVRVQPPPEFLVGSLSTAAAAKPSRTSRQI